MFKSKFAKQSVKKATSGLVATAIGLAVCLAPTAALAGNTTSVLVTGNGLRITAGGQQYWAYSGGAPANCFAVSSDTLKEWQSLAQAAILSGKTLSIVWADCGTPAVHIMYNVELLSY